MTKVSETTCSQIVENRKIDGKEFRTFTIFRFCDLTDCDIKGCKLEGCTFVGGKAKSCEFILCTKVKNSQLEDCVFDYCSILDCVVRRAVVTNSVTEDSTFKYVQIDASTDLYRSTVTDSVMDRVPVKGDVSDGFVNVADTLAESLDDAAAGGALCN